MRTHRARALASSTLLLVGLLAAAPAGAAATITIVNADGANEGFNDPTPVAPVGGNPGTTLGQQRLFAFQHAANLWGATLDSSVQIRIQSSFDPLSCNAGSAILGSAGTSFVYADFPPVEPYPGPAVATTWHHAALADKRGGQDYDPGQPDLQARFNVNLGQANCLTGVFWYLGLDANHGANIDLVTVLLHEFAHGLGFSQFASLTTGALLSGIPDVYNRNLLDTSVHLNWDVMSNAQRVASAVNARRLVWEGPSVTASVPGVLTAGTPLLIVNSPAAIAGDFPVGTAAFGPALTTSGITAQVVQALDPADGAGPTTTDACSALTNPAAVSGKLALVDRGTCTFVVKVKNAQNAGAIGVVVADNAADLPPPDLGGTDATIVIPAVRIGQADGTRIKAQLGAGVNAAMRVDLAVALGADRQDHAEVYAPNPVVTGSSVSHFEILATPNALMEPLINDDLTHAVDVVELTTSLLRDIGWFADADVDGLDDAADLDDDNDGALDGADCAPLDAGTFAIPAEVTGVVFDPGPAPLPPTMVWDSAAPGAGTATVHDVLRGAVGELPVGGGPAETCLASGIPGAAFADPAVPPAGAAGFWYLVRGRNDCGTDGYGAASDGTPRSSAVCP